MGYGMLTVRVALYVRVVFVSYCVLEASAQGPANTCVVGHRDNSGTGGAGSDRGLVTRSVVDD